MAGDPHWANVVFLSGFEGASVLDESPLAQTVTLAGLTAASTTWAAFGTKSLNRQWDTGSGAKVPYHASFPSGTGAFTVEGFFRFDVVNAGEQNLVAAMDLDAPARRWRLFYDNGTTDLVFEIYDSSTGWEEGIRADWTPTADTDYFIAVDFDGTKYRAYVNGTMISSTIAAYSLNTFETPPISLGSLTSSGNPDYGSFEGFMDEVRITAGVARYASDSGHTVPTAAFDRFADDGLDDEITEGIGMFGAASTSGSVYNGIMSQSVGAGSVLVVGQAATSADDIGITYRIGPVKAQPALAEDDINIAAALSLVRGVQLRDRVGVALSQLINQMSHLSLDEEVGAGETLRVAIPAALTGSIGVALAGQAQQAITVIEDLGLLETLGPAMIYGWTLEQQVSLASTLANFFGAEASDTVGITTSLLATAGKGVQLTETIGIAEDAAPQLIIHITTTEEIGLEATDVLQLLYSPVLSDGIELSAAYISPGSSVTTWAMNTRTGAVTEYSNYDFNSFARLGDVYIGASPNGLYKLTGDDDAGTDIVAQIKSGFAQWAGSRFTVLKGLYLGVRGEGDFVLKVITGDDKTYTYRVPTRDMRSTRVRTGKGIRSRYIRFELISTGQDFDLESVEFVPLVAERRV